MNEFGMSVRNKNAFTYFLFKCVRHVVNNLSNTRCLAFCLEKVTSRKYSTQTSQIMEHVDRN